MFSVGGIFSLSFNYMYVLRGASVEIIMCVRDIVALLILHGGVYQHVLTC